MSGETQQSSPLWARLGWFVLLWGAGVAAIGALAAVIRFCLSTA